MIINCESLKLPDHTLLSLKDLMEILEIKRTTLLSRVHRGKFPKPDTSLEALSRKCKKGAGVDYPRVKMYGDISHRMYWRVGTIKQWLKENK